ncbi:MAG: altronate hydrolase, partial [Chloroflexi bacterium]
GGRGVGTRNMIVLLGTSSLTAGFVRALEARLKPLADEYSNIDGIVAVAHTEGGHHQPNNRDLLLRTLAGFVVHPNVGAVLAIDGGHEAVTNEALHTYMTQHDYPLDAVVHHFMSLTKSFEYSLSAAEAIVRGWLPTVDAMTRAESPLSALRIALQCGGSDAFSGVSGNPLAAWVAKEVIMHGGAANLAETDELVGAESYVLKQVRDVATAQRFLAMVERFKTRAAWHGETVEGNPSGGNLYRGLYNIYLKSLGAAAKRHPDVRLDAVIEYGERMTGSGFYFMDSPGNDLESIAGQVAAGCNLIFFVTGNGSITNFPFVPTIKIVTTSARYRLLPNEMDVNAGAYLDGTPLDELGRQTFDLALRVASGQKSVGEEAGHAQVQIWRDWRLSQPVALRDLRITPKAGKPLAIHPADHVPPVQLTGYRTADGLTFDRVGLILPTSLCSGQIARMCAHRLNERGVGRGKGLSRFVSLVHTEGCGASNVDEYVQTLLNYATHPMVAHCLLLEHGCEKTHNAYFRHAMHAAGIAPDRFGWASVQIDGGIASAIDKMMRWFDGAIAHTDAPETATVGLAAMRIALLTTGEVSARTAQSLAELTRIIITGGGTVIIPQHDGLLSSDVFVNAALKQAAEATLNYGQRPLERGLHIMETYTSHWGETLTGLGATGVAVMLAAVNDAPMQSHPLVPVLSVTDSPIIAGQYALDIDFTYIDVKASWAQIALGQLIMTLIGCYTPKMMRVGNVDFQMTRGLLGISF